MLVDCDLGDILANRSLVVRQVVQIGPERFLPQALRPWIAGIYCQPTSAPLAVAHRLIGARTQSRIEIPPRCCLLRGKRARHAWTLAFPPLLQMLARRGEEPTRTVSLLADVELEEGGLDLDMDLAFEVHEPRVVA